MDIENAKTLLNKTKTVTNKVKENSKNPGFAWEAAAYAVRGVSASAPAVVIMCLENSWVKTSIGLLATVLIIALLIIFKEPLKTAASYAPGVIPFAIFVVVAMFFQATSRALLTVGISGLTGSGIAVPLHLKYLSYKKTEKSPELQALEQIAEQLK